MSNYAESTKALEKLRFKYGCKGEIIFRTAIQMLVEAGKYNILDSNWYQEQMDDIDARHDKAEAEGKFLFMTRDFEKAIYECTKDLCEIDTYDILQYIQREVWLGGDGISYERAIELLSDCLNYCEYETYEAEFALAMAREIGFEDYEIEELGYEYMLDCEKEEEE